MGGLLMLARVRVHYDIPAQIFNRTGQINQDIFSFIFKCDRFKVVTLALGRLRLLTQIVINVVFIFIVLKLGKEIMHDQAYAGLISLPHTLLIVVYMTVDPKHIEVDIDSEDWIFRLHI